MVGLFEGARFTETLLGIPGVGRCVFDSVNSKDYNIILAVVLMSATAFMLANLLVDIAQSVLDPRGR